jgi:hypothetical protein
MTKKIKFIARDKACSELILPPIPASKYVPDWWVEAPSYTEYPGQSTTKKRSFIKGHPMPNHSFKKCTPMHDALNAGYLIPLWADVWINDATEGPYEKEILWKTSRDVIGEVPPNMGVFQGHGPSSDEVEKPEDMAKGVYKYSSLLYIETPPGYSVLITQPFGYRNLPFQAIPAIVDADVKGIEVALPMWVRKDFTGVVERGTPVAQVIPFKRDDWNMDFSYLKDGEAQAQDELAFSLNIVNNYVKRQWSQKKFK